MSKFTADYFIEVFEKIPEEQWCAGEYESNDGRHCALGHCGAFEYDNGRDEVHTPESYALMMLFARANTNDNTMLRVGVINDRPSELFPQETPKQRIIAALHYIKENKQ